MNTKTGERLYNLLPAIYRSHDAAQGEPLHALLAVIEQEFTLLEGDIDRLYDNWFIETCDAWLVPYLGDLLGVRALLPTHEHAAFSQRALVANTIGYRRRKGTAAVLEQLARDVTGWPARVVEFFERLVTTQNVNHVRRHSQATVSLRDANQLELVGSPFERVVWTAEVRHIDHGRGRYNIPHAGIFLWRLQSYPVTRGTARAISALPDGRYTFNPLGLDTPLFNRPRTETEIPQLAAEEHVPGPLRRRPLYDELQARRQDLVAGHLPHNMYFNRQPQPGEAPQSVLEVFVQRTNTDPLQALRPEAMLICHLGDWRRPVSQTFTRSDGTAFTTQVAVDPVLGRLAFPTGVTPHRVEVSYAYGCAGDLGGGPYNRQASVARWLDPIQRPVTWQIGVTKDQKTLSEATEPTRLVSTLGEALSQWNQHVASNPSAFGVIAMMDSATYPEDLTGGHVIAIPAQSKLAIVAAGWPEEGVEKQRFAGHLQPDDLRPHLQGSVTVLGTAPATSTTPGQLIIDGLLIEGKLTVVEGNLGSLRLAHTTLAPSSSGLTVTASTPTGQHNERLTITLDHCICGPLALGTSIHALHIEDSIVDAGSGTAISAPVTAMHASTVQGTTQVQSLEASNSIFTDKVTVSRRQTGCVRFSYLPFDSLAPRRYRCQPGDTTAASRVAPQFTSIMYGEPSYRQLASPCPHQISTGADDEGEMGAFHFLQQAQRLQNLRASLGEYLRFGLEVGVFFMS